MKEQLFETPTIAEINQQLRGKFMQVIYGENRYCFRLLKVTDIHYNSQQSGKLSAQKKTSHRLPYCVKRFTYSDAVERIPLFDLRNEEHSEHSEQNPCENLTVFADALINGVIAHVGIIIDTLSDITKSVMSDFSFEQFSAG
ncbi:MAG: hypothetical protein JW795_01460 [Chitinivibrionales bacterium]|nr:hypothetical protein [Chitinivibrionales bacterium]